MATSGELFDQAVRHHQSGNLAQAEPLYRQILQADPAHGSACYYLGILLSTTGRQDEAAACLRQTLRLQPDNPDAHVYLGNALLGLKDLPAATECFKQALRILPNQAVAHNLLGIALSGQCNLAEAAESFRQALRSNPNFAEASANLGNALAGLGQFAEAAKCYRQTLRLDPGNRSALWNQARLCLLQGDFENGWPNYELRWVQPGKTLRSFPQPRWDGSPLQGKTILVHADGGLGDSIQFARYFPMIQERGGIVVFECQPALGKLLAGIKGVDRIIPAGTPCPPFDVHIPLLSLPGVFHTTLASIPVATLALFSGEPKATAHSAVAFGSALNVGIVWQGGLAAPGDLRSLPLAHFEVLARVPGVRLFSLQVGPGRSQLQTAGFPVTDLGSNFNENSLEDLAAALMNVDLVVTIDTVAAHLAGALGRPVWVALGIAACWRWLLDREDSPWYPTMRLFRQKRLNDWDDVFERMAMALKSKADERILSNQG